LLIENAVIFVLKANATKTIVTGKNGFGVGDIRRFRAQIKELTIGGFDGRLNLITELGVVAYEAALK